MTKSIQPYDMGSNPPSFLLELCSLKTAEIGVWGELKPEKWILKLSGFYHDIFRTKKKISKKREKEESGELYLV